MKRLPLLVLLGILTLGAAWYAFVALSSDTDDGVDTPEAQMPLTLQDEVAMANAACGGHAAVDAKKAISCKVCPANSDFAGSGTSGEGWSDEGVLTGSFTAPGQDEALLHATGCESHANNMGGDFLLRRTSGKWNVVRYAKGASAGPDCMKTVWDDGRDAVICQMNDMHQGVSNSSVHLMAFDAAPPSGVTNDYKKVNFVVTNDGSGNCGYPMGDQTMLQFDKVDRAYLMPTATSRPSLVVKVTLARAKPGPASVTTCPAAPPQSYTVTWKNLGDHFEAADGFVALAARAEDKCCELIVTQRVEPARY